MSDNKEKNGPPGNDSTFAKAELIDRYVAKLVDVLIAGTLFFIPFPVGPAAAITYLLVADGLKRGPSPGWR